jgi:hypothetical protein
MRTLGLVAVDKAPLTGARLPPQETLNDRGDSPSIDIVPPTVRGTKPIGESLVAPARIACAAAERDALDARLVKTFSPIERRAMIKMLEGSLVGWRSLGARISFHGLSAVNASLVSISEFVLDVARNTEAVPHRE